MDNQRIKDSGKQRQFETGAHRDAATGKGRCDLLPMKQVKAAEEASDTIYVNIGSDYKSMEKESILAALDGIIEVQILRDESPEEALHKMQEVAAAAAIAAGAEEALRSNDLQNVEDLSTCAIFWYGVMQVSKHFEEGAAKYGENNWQRGMPLHVYFDSCTRHLIKAISGMKDEPHLRAACWNALCFLWTAENKPELNDFYAGKAPKPE